MFRCLEVESSKTVFEARKNLPKWLIFELLNEARMDSLNGRFITESTHKNDAKSYLLVVSYADYNLKQPQDLDILVPNVVANL